MKKNQLLSVCLMVSILFLSFPLYAQKTDTASIVLPSIIQLNSEPPDAQIYIDGAFAGVTPFQEQIVPGNHRIVVKKEMYLADSVDMFIPNGSTKVKQFDLKANYGVAEIQTTPVQGAEVFLNNVFVGITPYVSQRMISGQYSFRIEKKMYKTVSLNLILEKGAINTQVIALPVNFGTLNVRSTKSNILIDGKPAGKDECTIQLDSGKHLVRAERSFQYSPVEQLVDIEVSTTRLLELNPKPRYGSLSVIVEPHNASDADVSVSDELKGKAPLVMQSLIGDYTVHVSKNAYLSELQEITVRENEHTKVKFDLITVEESRRRSINNWKRSKWISAGVGLFAAGTSAYLNYRVNGHYQSYVSAKTTERALYFRERTNTTNRYFSISIGVLGTAAITSLYSWIKEGSF
ncbi:MAG: PEGA domain-containing protein [Bacteroidota bacterium]